MTNTQITECSADENLAEKPSPNKELPWKSTKCKGCSKIIGARLARCDTCFHQHTCIPAKECLCTVKPISKEPEAIEAKEEKLCLNCLKPYSPKRVCSCGLCYACDPYFGLHGDSRADFRNINRT